MGFVMPRFPRHPRSTPRAHRGPRPAAGCRQRGRHPAQRRCLRVPAGRGAEGNGRALVAQGAARRHGRAFRLEPVRRGRTRTCWTRLQVPLLATSSHAGEYLHPPAALALRLAVRPRRAGRGAGSRGPGAPFVRIVQPGGEESLNVAAAAAICLHASAAGALPEQRRDLASLRQRARRQAIIRGFPANSYAQRRQAPPLNKSNTGSPAFGRVLGVPVTIRRTQCFCRNREPSLPPSWRSQTARSFSAARSAPPAPPAARSCSTRPHRLPGNPHRPQLLPADRHADVSAHRQLRRQRRGRRGQQGPRRRPDHPRPAPGRLQLPRRPHAVSSTCSARTRSASPTSTPASSPASCAPRARRTAASSACSPARKSRRPWSTRPWPRRARRRPWRAWTWPRTCRSTKSYGWDQTEWHLGSGYGQLEPAEVPRGRLRLRREEEHPAHAGRARLQGHRGAGEDARPPRCASSSPDGVFLSNGPGDPQPCDYAIDATRELVEDGYPTFGICLGHQILALASGAKTFKMKFGHHGANHPVKDLDNGRVSITSQNHGFAVDEKTLPGNLRAHARVAVRRHAAGPGAHRQAGVLLPGPPGSLARGRTTSATCSTSSPA
jgi:hypothetical protein